ncbi:hypothetical protein HMI54_010053 [Coelomomyces lativittatus]|nr:hypothetical protein HMI54_010053 [Coelomomyces lativittatus]KAJ1510404.1 hypothetical protein HMI56_006358 [Coelomomyces lativittatus]KAJ1512048.1 hypothetical protein HMI55_006370 [Coelomomyces lativittatus]
MDLLFGQRKTPSELLRQHQRSLNRTIRDLDREKIKLEQQEKKVIIEIKKLARAGQMNACKVMAKDLVRTRQYIQKFYQMRTQLQAVGLRMQTMQSNQTMTEAMKGVTKALRSMNKGVNLPQITKIMMDFEKENELMDMKEELMNDAVDDVMGDVDDEQEEDEIIMKVLDEIGIQLDQQLVDTPSSNLLSAPSKTGPDKVALGELGLSVPSASTDDDAALMARFEMLRK